MWHYIARDNDLIAMLTALEKRFWHNVETLTPPPMDGSEASSELLSRLYPNANNKTQITRDDALPLITQFEEALDAEKTASERKDEAANKLKALMGAYEICVAGDRTITWKNISSERLDSKVLKLERPEIYSKYVSRNSYRRFSIK
ncbi:hypothetical protein [Desulfosporosinus sp. BICA1-9]|uniref:hypothetical protein n=1 Tax=Desulfosporosinus sp. BICA1-9 TaxID=1531958 RepID=UPI000A90F61A|nr:hypothetical protein [Desulfosporosinus sp. BICA1-9]HBW38296.1 hypothetical protein [Desulfosporosinus sp.]